MQRLSFIFLIYTTIAHTIADSFEAETIIGGADARDYEFTYHATILQNGKLKCGCGALDKRTFLAAAHCFISIRNGLPKPMNFTIMAPARNKNYWSSAKMYIVDRIYVPKIYERNSSDPSIPRNTYQGDIILFKVKKNVATRGYQGVRMLLLPDNDLSYVGETATIAGQGYTTVYMGTDPETGRLREFGSSDCKLRSVQATVISNGHCNTFYSYEILSSQICAQAVQRDTDNLSATCIFDSGGPLVINNNIVIGVLISGPSGCDEREKSAIYTRVSSYLPMVQSVLRDQSYDEMTTYIYKKTQDSGIISFSWTKFENID